MLPDVIEQGLEDGRVRNLRALTESDFEIEGIASRLAKINRFCGATQWPLSVATHSLMVSYLATPRHALTGLLHDISESFGINDMISPLKKINPAYRELEADIVEQLCVPFPCLRHLHAIERADKRATSIEAYIHRGHFPDWAHAMGEAHGFSQREDALAHDLYRRELGWRQSRDLFVSRYFELLNELRDYS